MCFITTASYVIFVITLIYDPRSTIFLGNLVPEKYFVLPIRLIVIAFHAFLLAYIHINNVTAAIIIVAYGFYTTPIIVRELRMGRSMYKTSDSLRVSTNIRWVYRSLQVLQVNALNIYGMFILICNAAIMASLLHCNKFLFDIGVNCNYWPNHSC